ncbi:RING-14 protein [Xylogone sp. PMI_703]|nr:RING-14 protein [Xylogone sp. PMI_703]
MKFSHAFSQALLEEGFPEEWVNSAIPYAQLKKVIKRVARELSSLGLDPTILAQLMQSASEADVPSPRRGSGDGLIGFKYDLGDDRTEPRPKLTLYVQLEDGLAVDARLSPDTRAYFERLALRNGAEKQTEVEPAVAEDAPLETESTEPKPDPSDREQRADNKEGPKIQQIEVPLTFDAEFFALLRGDVSVLDSIQTKEQAALSTDITALSNVISQVTRPSKHGKTDLYRWREIFELYLSAGVFFSTLERDRGRRNHTEALKQLKWFQEEIMKRDIPQHFKLPASHQALAQFNKINLNLFRNLKFQEMNRTAISKILKKFDKRTQLGARQTFPRLIQSDSSIMSETMAKNVCAQVSNNVVGLVPQVDDHLCPVCYNITWRPVRLACGHVVCSGCVVQMQTKGEKKCPVCRGMVIMKASEDDIDDSHLKFLKTYFPKETKARRVELETIDGKARFGEAYTHPSEEKCLVM